VPNAPKPPRPVEAVVVVVVVVVAVVAPVPGFCAKLNPLDEPLRPVELGKLKLDEPVVEVKPPKPVPVGAVVVVPVEPVVDVAPRPLGAVEEAESVGLAPKFKPVEVAPPVPPNNEPVLVFAEFEPKLNNIFA
jgi:hypothetical protein